MTMQEYGAEIHSVMTFRLLTSPGLPLFSRTISPPRAGPKKQPVAWMSDRLLRLPQRCDLRQRIP
jgi:hypothetical protein